MRLTQRQVQALWQKVYDANNAEVQDFWANEWPDLTRNEAIDLEARLYVAAHPELVQHVIELDVER